MLAVGQVWAAHSVSPSSSSNPTLGSGNVPNPTPASRTAPPQDNLPQKPPENSPGAALPGASGAASSDRPGEGPGSDSEHAREKAPPGKGGLGVPITRGPGPGVTTAGSSPPQPLRFRFGFHQVPSMHQLHLHAISQDLDSPHLKHKKHWNSFASPFFRDALQVISQIEQHGHVLPALPTTHISSSVAGQNLFPGSGETSPRVPPVAPEAGVGKGSSAAVAEGAAVAAAEALGGLAIAGKSGERAVGEESQTAVAGGAVAGSDVAARTRSRLGASDELTQHTEGPMLKSVVNRSYNNRKDSASLTPFLDSRCRVEMDARSSGEGSAFPLQSLPDELLLQCLARVSSESDPGCLRLQGVCGKWRKLLSSDSFLDLRRQVGRATEWLVTLTWRIEGGLLCKLFDSLTTKCQRLPCSFNGLPPSRQYFGVTSVGHTVYVIGGQTIDNTGIMTDLTFSAAVDSYNPLTNTSRSLLPLKTPRSRFACCASSDAIFVIGGVTSAYEVLSSIEVFDLRQECWLEASSLPAPRQGAHAQIIGNRLFVLGGCSSPLEDTDPNYTLFVCELPILNSRSSRTTTIIPSSSSSSQCTSIANSNLNPRQAQRSINLEWREAASLPAPRFGFQTAVLHNRLCVIGGAAAEPDGWQAAEGQGHSSVQPLSSHDSFSSPSNFLLNPPSSPPSLRPITGAEHRLACQHRACYGYQSRGYACVALNGDLFLVRRCDQSRNSYCRHIHKFDISLANSGYGAAWECIQRTRAYSSLLTEAGDCWEHSVAIAIVC
ncbi:unnamed protein product [Closterium sp. NIES-54]